MDIHSRQPFLVPLARDYEAMSCALIVQHLSPAELQFGGFIYNHSLLSVTHVVCSTRNLSLNECVSLDGALWLWSLRVFL